MMVQDMVMYHFVYDGIIYHILRQVEAGADDQPEVAVLPFAPKVAFLAVSQFSQEACGPGSVLYPVAATCASNIRSLYS